MKKQDSKAQNMSEYVIVIGIVSLAFIGMQTYMKRGIQGVVKDFADELSNQDAYNEKRENTSIAETSTSTSSINGSKPQIKTISRPVAGGVTTITTNRTVDNVESNTSTSIVTE